MENKLLENIGKDLIEEYGLADSVATLERWMLHYLAELFEREKISTNSIEKKEIKSEIMTIILEFWKLRYQIANEESWIKKNQDLINTLTSISPQNENPFSKFFNPYDKNSYYGSDSEWQEKLIAIDQASKVVMSHYVLEFLKGIDIKNNSILQTIALIEKIESPESIFAQFYDAEQPKKEEKEDLENRIKNLNIFIDSAQSVLKVMKIKVDRLP